MTGRYPTNHGLAKNLCAQFDRRYLEEKILELQNQKRELAEAIISANGAPLKNFTPDDLQLLLS